MREPTLAGSRRIAAGLLILRLPWGLAQVGGHLWIATTPVLGGFIALYLMRAWDGYSVAAWWQAREARRAH